MRPFLFLFVVCLGVSCSSKSTTTTTDTEQPPAPSLIERWATDTLLRTPESVLFDPTRNLAYVSNVNQNPWEKDGNGFLSKIDLAGNIIELAWVTGLNGPKGMGIRDNKLLVADIDEVVEIELETGAIVHRFGVEGTPTLNDITVYQGEVYVSGSDSNTIFELKDGKLTPILAGELGRPNGLFAETDRLLMITSSSSELYSIDKATKAPKLLVGKLGHGDGIVPVGNGGYLASSWRGEIFYLTSDWHRTQLLDTQEAKINAADIEYVIDQHLLLVPTFFDNRVVAYELVK